MTPHFVVSKVNFCPQHHNLWCWRWIFAIDTTICGVWVEIFQRGLENKKLSGRLYKILSLLFPAKVVYRSFLYGILISSWILTCTLFFDNKRIKLEGEKRFVDKFSSKWKFLCVPVQTVSYRVYQDICTSQGSIGTSRVCLMLQEVV